MEANGVIGGLYKISTWITKLALLNFLWLFYSLIGLILLGFFPATISMFTITRQWVIGNDEIPIFKTFWETFKEEFSRGNLLGLTLLVISIILFVDIKFLFSHASGIWMVIFSFIIILSFIYMLILLYVFPTYVHYELSIRQVLRNSFLILLMNPRSTMMMITGIITLYLLANYYLAFTLVFGGSLFSLWLMWYANKAFINVQQKKEMLKNFDY